MSPISDIISAQKTLEETFLKKMTDLESQINCAGPAKDTVAKVAEEFRTFRELIFSMLGLLRKQIGECCRQIDAMETRQRRKSLIFLGVKEDEKEDCKALTLQVINNHLSLKNITASSIGVCHRLGVSSNERQRPILVKFSSVDDRSSVWKAKSGLKGSSISVKEFLTKTRQSIFAKARMHFGVSASWTQNGTIVVKVPGGIRHKVTTMDELNPLLMKYPKAQSASSVPGDLSAGDIRSRKQ